MAEPKTKCTRCGAEMLVSTAKRTGGLCMACKLGRPLPLRSEEELEKELHATAASVEERLQLLRIPAERIAMDEWNKLDPDLCARIPVWFRSLLSEHALVGATLEDFDQQRGCQLAFSFLVPDDYDRFSHAYYWLDLSKAGLLMVGEESNGNVWVSEASVGSGAKIFLFEPSDWSGGGPSRSNGLRLFYTRLAELLTCARISPKLWMSETTAQSDVTHS